MSNVKSQLKYYFRVIIPATKVGYFNFLGSCCQKDNPFDG